MTVVKDPDAEKIDCQEMSDAVDLVRWHLGEALRLYGAFKADFTTRQAVKLLEWLQSNHPDGTFSLRDILRNGPAELREKGVAEPAIDKLVEYGQAIECGHQFAARAKRWRLAG